MENKDSLVKSLKEEYKYVTYLIGSMEKTAQKDDGSEKREYYEKELYCRNVYPINPVKLEAQKTGMTTDEIKIKMKGWVESGNWDLFRTKAIEIWKGKDVLDTEGGLKHIMGDVDYVLVSDWITCIYQKGDSPVGTWFEVGIALEHNIPVYLITDINKVDLPKSLLQAITATNGEVFYNKTQYFNFIDEKYKLKRKEEEKK